MAMAATESARQAAPGPSSARAGAGHPAALTVAQVVGQIRALIEQRFPSPLWIQGELSNCTYAGSGHIYFSLVDETATDRFGQRLVLPCAFFKGANQHLKFKLTDGLKVLCLGQVTTYEGRGQYQLRVLQVEPKGIGALQLAFDQLKKRLSAAGLFEEARKKPIPRLPQRVGLITSLHGSAIHDMVSKLRGRFDVIILPAKVQGDGAAREIAEALDRANALRAADVLIVGRGGGSVEDLWAFNEEPVAQAIARSRIPVISAVGHQDDWTIADYVADLRASTPTDAAKLLVNEQQTLLDRIEELRQRLLDAATLYLDDQAGRLADLRNRLRLLHPAHLLRQQEQRSQQLRARLIQAMRHGLEREDRRLSGLAGRLHALSPLAVLARGYSATFKLPQRVLVTDASTVHPHDELETMVARGRILSTVRAVRTGDPDGTNAA